MKRTDDTVSHWRRTAKSRLRFELAGLAFACKKGFKPEDYARHLWRDGAVRWVGKSDPGAGEYLQKEARAFEEFYPEVSFTVVKKGDKKAELVFTDGCLGGWDADRWAVARSLGLTEKDICAYCREAFHVWAEQLGLDACIGPQDNETCRLTVTRP